MGEGDGPRPLRPRLSTYEIAGDTVTRAPTADVMQWLTDPDRMSRWMTGVDSVERTDAGVRVVARAGVYAGWVFIGELVERADARLVRSYRLEQEEGYERVVTWSLSPTTGGGTRIACSAVTTIPGLAASAARAGARAEQKGLARSLDRLRAAADGERRGLLSRWRDGTPAASPL